MIKSTLIGDTIQTNTKYNTKQIFALQEEDGESATTPVSHRLCHQEKYLTFGTVLLFQMKIFTKLQGSASQGTVKLWFNTKYFQ